MKRSFFKTGKDYEAYLARGKAYFQENCDIATCYINARSQPAMLLHLHEGIEKTNELLSLILDKLSGDEKDEIE